MWEPCRAQFESDTHLCNLMPPQFASRFREIGPRLSCNRRDHQQHGALGNVQIWQITVYFAIATLIGCKNPFRYYHVLAFKRMDLSHSTVTPDPQEESGPNHDLPPTPTKWSRRNLVRLLWLRLAFSSDYPPSVAIFVCFTNRVREN